LKKKAVVATAAALGMALLFYAQGAKAANLASENGSLYQNPWGPDNPQNQTTTGFGPWVFDRWNPNPSDSDPWRSTPPPGLFFIDTTRGAWGINVPADIVSGHAGYDAAWRGFTGDGFLDPGQTFSTTVLFTPPGPYSPTETPTEGIDFFAQDPAVPSKYDSFGHQVLGIYLGPSTASVPTITLVVHTALSDEHPEVVKHIPLPFTGTASSPQAVNISFTQLAQGHWILKMISGDSTLVFTSQEYGGTWNTSQGLDGVRYFTSQGGTNPGGPMEWKDMSVRRAPADLKAFNGDGYADLVWENTSTGERAIWLLKKGVFSSKIDLPTVPVQWHIAGVGDFKGDGNAGLVWENTSTGQRGIWLLKKGVFSSKIDLPTVPVQWHIVGVGDFNGDGNADLVWENTSTGQRAIWLLKNGVFSSSLDLPTVPVQWHIAGVGDFKSDGNADLVWENTSTGQRGIWFFKNGVVSGSLDLPTIPVQWHIAGAGDFSGDGNAGLVWQNTGTGERAIWFMKNGVLTKSIDLPMVPLTWRIEDH
jgi:hypothetical protein